MIQQRSLLKSSPTLTKIKKIITLSPTYEDNGQTYFLDLILIREESKIDIDTYR